MLMEASTDTEEFVAALRAHSRRYHDAHPFHRRMNQGTLDRRQIQGWVANRFYYQEAIPRKDAAILANCPDREVRRQWIRRILDHDGTQGTEGGIEAWLRLGEAVGLSREEVRDERHVVPTVRFAVDAYVTFARTRPWIEAVASSLTELFAPKIHKERISGMLENYNFIDDKVMAYFKRRLTQAPRDADFALQYVLKNAHTREEQEACIEAVRFKCNVLWVQLDALYHAYVDGHIPPGAFRPEV